MSKIVVIGAGVVGLSTAINIQQCMPGANVTIIADKFNQYTTSDGAGGVIAPVAQGIDDATQKKWGRASMDYFTRLAVSEESAESGASITMGIVCRQEAEPPSYSDLMLTFNPLPRETAVKLGLGMFKNSYVVTTIIVQGRKYLPYLMKRFKNNGGSVVQRKVESFRELLGVYDVVVNCAGLGGGQLAGDDKLVSMRGQMIRVSAPWIKHFLMTYYDPTQSTFSSFMPTAENGSIGGVKQVGNTDTMVDPETTEQMWKRMTTIWPPLKPAKLLWEWVGLRPYRDPVRVEAETIRFGDKTLKVVHNYGHGQWGISLSWGTAIHAAELVKDLTTPTSRL